MLALPAVVMTDILDLPGWTVLNKTLDQDGYLIEAEFTEQPNACQKCGVIDRLYLHGPKPVIYRDSPIRGNAVRVLARVQRYRCRDCDETFMQPLHGVEPNRRLTNRCIEYIASQCLRDTFIRLALHIGCDEKTIRNVANDYIEHLNACHALYLPEWLGIDETGIDGRMRCVLTDVVDRVPIDMLGNRDKGTLATWLNHFREADRKQVQGVAIDMWRPYKTVADLLLPNRPVIVDKFHVVRMANYAMEKVRIRLGREQRPAVKVNWLRNKALLNKRLHNLSEQQKFALGMWLDNEPEIARAYRLKEAFYDIYALSGQQEAGEALDAWRESIPEFMKPDFKELLSATKNWRPEILAYFDHPVTNGYTEALNGTAKVINRAGRGYTFEVLRARVLFGKDRVKATKPKPMAPGDLYAQSELMPPPECEEPKAKGCWAPDQKLRRMLLRREQNRCMSCKGLYDPINLYVTRMGPLMDGEPEVNAALLCGECKVRFHTGTLQQL